MILVRSPTRLSRSLALLSRKSVIVLQNFDSCSGAPIDEHRTGAPDPATEYASRAR
jgi:hypothetical protein